MTSAQPPRQPLLSLDDALAQITARVGTRRCGVETLPLPEARGRVLAQAVVSMVDVPPLDNSAMDGYAMRAADVAAPGTALPISQRIAAGHVGQPLQAGTAARIFTGAPVPPGADAVVMQEQCDAPPAQPGQPAVVQVHTQPKIGQNIRLRGEDVRAGSEVLPQGLRLSPAALGLAASAGHAKVQVYRRPRVALLTTGDELVMPGQPLPPGAIYNSNRYTLRGLIEACGGVCSDLGVVPDNLAATRAALREAAAGHDVIVSTGGVSVGEEDHLKAAVQAEGELNLWQVAIKPGKPLAFGTVGSAVAGAGSLESGALFFGLPGNPVACFVTFLLAVRPALMQLSGQPGQAEPAQMLRADFDWTRPDPKRREFLRARRNAQGGVELFPNQGSAVLTSAVWADGLVDLPAGQTVQRGQVVRFLAFADCWV